MGIALHIGAGHRDAVADQSKNRLLLLGISIGWLYFIVSSSLSVFFQPLACFLIHFVQAVGVHLFYILVPNGVEIFRRF